MKYTKAETEAAGAAMDWYFEQPREKQAAVDKMVKGLIEFGLDVRAALVMAYELCHTVAEKK